jgi:hypothetical protein
MILKISVTSPLPSEPWTAVVELEGGGREHIRIENGWFEGEMPARPRRVTCLLDAVPEARASATRAPSESAASLLAVDVMGLFGRGVEVPENGRLDLQLLWLAPCDGVPDEAPEGKRFGSYEHTLCAERIGKNAAGGALEIEGIRAHFSSQWDFNVGGKSLRFGIIIALAGDFYAHLDDEAARDFAWAWPEVAGLRGWLAGDYRAMTLAGDNEGNVDALHDHIHHEVAGGQYGGLAEALNTLKLKHPMRRYLALASQNICHFACQNTGYSPENNPALSLYRAYHERALKEARAAGEAGDRDALDAALVADAFGCHFLTDLFASGHIRVPRDVLGERFGITKGALVMSKRIHDEDNREGLWVTPMKPSEGARVVWRAYGDDSLQIDEARAHLAQIQEAVRRSTAEVFAAYCAVRAGVSPQAMPAAEDLVPVPLPPGEGPVDTDVSPDGTPLPDLPPNRPPLYKILDDGRVAERGRNGYVPLESRAPAPAPGMVVP